MRSRLATLILLSVGLACAGVPAALAAPEDPVSLRGTLAWPPVLAREPFVVLQADDGRLYYTDLSVAQRRGVPLLRAGDRVSVLGVESSKPHEIRAVAFGSGDTALAALPLSGSEVAASPRTEAVPPVGARTAAPRADERPWERIEGRMLSVSGKLMNLMTRDGRAVVVDMSNVGTTIADTLPAGAEVTVFGISERGRPFVAVGFIHATQMR